MTIEQKAKAYDNIIEKANKMHSENCEACQMCIEELIPELAESEDEKIKKEIICVLKEIEDDEEWCGTQNIKRYITFLEKQGEQKPVEWSDEDEKILKETLRMVEKPGSIFKGENLIKKVADWLSTLKDRVVSQPKQEWSEEDKCMLNNVIDTLKPLSQTTHSGYAINNMIDWLKSLRPQSY